MYLQVREGERLPFSTKHGRAVKDGGGIEPDVRVPSIKFAPAESLFISKGIYSDFISHYLSQHPDLTPRLEKIAAEVKFARQHDGRFLAGSTYFALDPEVHQGATSIVGALGISPTELYSAFKTYVTRDTHGRSMLSSAVDTIYRSRLEALRAAITGDGLLDVSRDATVDIQKNLESAILKDMDGTREAISFDLTQALLARSLPDRLLLQRNIDTDPQVLEAVKLIASPSRIQSILQGTDH